MAALNLHHAFKVACCFWAAFVLLLNFEYIDIHLVSDISVSYVHVLHLPSPPGGPPAMSDSPRDCWQKSLIVRALGLTPKGTPGSSGIAPEGSIWFGGVALSVHDELMGVNPCLSLWTCFKYFVSV